MSKHTPGPYTVEASDRLEAYTIRDRHGLRLALIDYSTKDPATEERQIDLADARLFAAAPEMFDLIYQISSELWVSGSSIDGKTPRPPINDRVKHELCQKALEIIDKVYGHIEGDR